MEREISLSEVLEAVRRQRRLIVAIALAGAVVALVLSLLQPKVYEATAEVLLQATPSEVVLGGDQQQNPQFLEQQVRTEVALMSGTRVRDAVEEELGHEPEVAVRPKTGTLVVSVVGEGDTPAAARREADLYASTYVKLRRAEARADLLEAAEALNGQITQISGGQAALDLKVDDLNARVATAGSEAERVTLTVARDEAKAAADRQRADDLGRLSTLRQQAEALDLAVTLNERQGVRVVSDARSSATPVSPTPIRNTLLGLVLGLLVGLAVAFTRERLDESLRTRDDLDRAVGHLPVLGVIPRSVEWTDPASALLESVDHPTSASAEAYRMLRTSLEFVAMEHETRTIHITSASAREGKTTTAANLAVSLAAGRRTVVVDGDLRRPRLHKFFQLQNGTGFTSVLLGTVALDDALEEVAGVSNLWVLPSGPIPVNPAEALGVPMVQTVFEQLLARFDVVVVDSPPVVPVSDSLVLSRYADATLVVATAGTTSRKALARSLELLAQVDAPVRGVVFNGVGEDRHLTDRPPPGRSPTVVAAPPSQP